MALAKIVTGQINIEVMKYAKNIQKLMKSEVHVKSGALQNSISIEKKGKGHYLVGVDAAKLKADPRNPGSIDYSVPYYFGHGPYIIRPKRAKALRWVGKDGQVHFAKFVRIPASAGDPFIERVMFRRPRI